MGINITNIAKWNNISWKSNNYVEGLHDTLEGYKQKLLEDGTVLMWEKIYTPWDTINFDWLVQDRQGNTINNGNSRALNEEDRDMNVEAVVKREYEFSLMKRSLY